MAEENLGQSRTEAPTQRRRDEARQQGQAALSQDLTHGLQLLAGAGALWWGGRGLGRGLLETIQRDLATAAPAELTPADVGSLLGWLSLNAVTLAGLVVGAVFACGLVVGTYQAGFQVTPELVAVRWDRLSFAAGWSRMASSAAAIRAVLALLKAAVIVGVAWWVLRGREAQIATLGEGTLAQALSQIWDLLIRLTLAIAASLTLLGLADYAWQKFRHERSLMMTRQEVVDEQKREEGNPQMRGRLRRAAREISRARMMQDVPRASVVITNPTHLAVALLYERGVTPAPRVVARGAGHVARRIVELARNHAVPVVERKPLARALFKGAKVGQTIPAALYYAAAEVLAYVYRLRRAA